MIKNVKYLIFVLIFSTSSFSQSLELKLAKEYVINNEFEKAINLYEKLARKNENLQLIYVDYVETLKNLKKDDDLNIFFRKIIKTYPHTITYRIDYYLFLRSIGSKAASKEFDQIKQGVQNNPNEAKGIYEQLLKSNAQDDAIQILLVARKTANDDHLYAQEVASVYKLQNKTDLVIEELISFLKANPYQLEDVKNNFQNLLSDKEDFDKLEDILYKDIQKEPEEIAYNELLLWLNLQKKEFGKAYIQAKALDKRLKLEGNRLLQIGKIALENKDFENAVKYFQAITNDYKNTSNYPVARRLLINTKEEKVKTTYPINIQEVQSLIKEYQSLIKEVGKSTSTLEAMRSLALLNAFYLDKKDTAITILKEVAELARSDEFFKAKIKLDIGDIYLLKSEPWESTLLYSQVEKSQKDEVLGHEAKLRNAKLSYYKGEFKLAQEHLDVLKLATSREIANDAMNLSILIQDNTAFDTAAVALSEYSKIDLLLFQNKIAEAIEGLDQLTIKYAAHSLIDEVLLSKARIQRKVGQYEKAIEDLNKLIENYGNDIYGDDALFLLANILEEDLKDKQKALEHYQTFLFKYPGSIFTVEARKRLRLLRGDKL